MQVTSIRIYPVKSMGGLATERARVETWGLEGDRRWGVVDAEGEKITAREVPALLGFRAQPAGSCAVRITDRAGDSILVDPPIGAVRVTVGHARQGSALPAGEAANRWLSERLHQSVRLVWQDDPTMRSIAEDRGGHPGEHLSLADAGPLLLVTEASMARLNSWIADDAELPDVPGIDPHDLSDPGAPAPSGRGAEPLDIVRFRPNVIVDGEVPFAEDGWAGLRIDAIDFRTTMSCDRCVMTTIDPVTLIGGKEPIRTLARHRRWDRKTWFGIRIVPLSTGAIAVGSPVVPARAGRFAVKP